MKIFGSRIVFAGIAAIAMSFLFAGALAAPPHAGDIPSASATTANPYTLSRM